MDEEQSFHGRRCVVGRRRQCRLSLFQTGIGDKAAGNAAQRAASVHRFDFLVSSGFASALVPAAVGDLVIGTEVVAYDHDHGRAREKRVFPSGAEEVALATRVAQSVGLVARTGRIVTVPRVLSLSAEKRTVADRSGAIGADMESAAICASGESTGTSVLVVRAVSDLLEEDLALDFNQFLGPTGWIRGMLYCTAHPRTPWGLNRLRRQAVIGADRLTRFFVQFFDELG